MRVYELYRGEGFMAPITIEADFYDIDALDNCVCITFLSKVGSQTFRANDGEPMELSQSDPVATYSVSRGWHVAEKVGSIMSDVDAILRGAKS